MDNNFIVGFEKVAGFGTKTITKAIVNRAKSQGRSAKEVAKIKDDLLQRFKTVRFHHVPVADIAKGNKLGNTAAHKDLVASAQKKLKGSKLNKRKSFRTIKGVENYSMQSLSPAAARKKKAMRKKARPRPKGL